MVLGNGRVHLTKTFAMWFSSSFLHSPTQSTRRNLFTSNSTCRSSTSNFYRRDVPSAPATDVDGDESWQPGEYLVPHPPQPDIQSLLSQTQSAITAQIQRVQTSVDNLSGRVDRLEDNISDTTEQLQLCQASLSSSSTSTDSEEPSRQRKRRVAPDKSVSLYLL